jgi:hypothetical protein
MDRLQLYKEFYFFEIKRKSDLDGAITTPVVTISTVITLNFYFLKNTVNPSFNAALIGLCIVIGCTIIYSVLFLSKSFFNLGKANVYREINSMLEYYQYDQKLKDVNKSSDFEPYLEERFATCASHNFELNRRRSHELGQGKKGIYASILVTFATSIVYIISII